MRPSHPGCLRSPDQGLGHACSWPLTAPSSHLSSTSPNSYTVVNFSFLLSRYNREHINVTIPVSSLMNFYISRYQYNHPNRSKYFQALLRFLCSASQVNVQLPPGMICPPDFVTISQLHLLSTEFPSFPITTQNHGSGNS